MKLVNPEVLQDIKGFQIVSAIPKIMPSSKIKNPTNLQLPLKVSKLIEEKPKKSEHQGLANMESPRIQKPEVEIQMCTTHMSMLCIMCMRECTGAAGVRDSMVLDTAINSHALAFIIAQVMRTCTTRINKAAMMDDVDLQIGGNSADARKLMRKDNTADINII